MKLVQLLASKLFLLLVRTVCRLISFFFPDRRGKDYLPAIDEEILLKPVSELTQLIKTGRVKVERVVQAFIERINHTDPLVNAVIDRRFHDAIREAREIDDQIIGGTASPELLSKSLLGIPFVGKDHVQIKGLSFTAGLMARKGIVGSETAPIVQNLLNEGAICIGMASCPELSFSVDCSSMLYGRTNNPYDLSRSPGGSSGGGAAVVAYAGSPIAVGTDIGGEYLFIGISYL